MTGFPPKVRQSIKERAGIEGDYIRCEMCGQFSQYVQLHHRRPRQGKNLRPDTNAASNGVSLCMADHAWCEENRLAAMEKGLLLRQHQTPPDEPVELWDGLWRLTDDGDRIPGGGVSNPALAHRCHVCKSKPGKPCCNTIRPGEPLPGREVHDGRTTGGRGSAA